MIVNGVRIGDKFKHGKNSICEVVDFHEVKSYKTGFFVRYICVVKPVNTLATNEFEVPFATVQRNKVHNQ